MKRLLIIFVFSLLSLPALATEQISELLIVGKDTLQMFATPMEQMRKSDSVRYAKFREIIENPNVGHYSFSTGLLRGYRGLWRIKNDTLCFVSTQRILDEPIDLKGLFSKDEPATWFSGKLRVSRGGELLRYWHMGFSSIWEHETVYHVEQGVVKEVRNFHNTIVGAKTLADIKIPITQAVRDTIWKQIVVVHPDWGKYKEVKVYADITPDTAGTPVKYAISGLSLWTGVDRISIDSDTCLLQILEQSMKFDQRLPVCTLYDTIRPLDITLEYEPIKELFIPDEAAFEKQMTDIIKAHHPNLPPRRQVQLWIELLPDSSGRHIQCSGEGRVYVGTETSLDTERGWVNLETDDPCIQAMLGLLKIPGRIPVHRIDDCIYPWTIDVNLRTP